MKILLLLLAVFFFNSSPGQGKEDFYVFDQNWKPTEVKTAVYLLIIRQTPEKTFEWTYYNFAGPRIRQEVFSDKEGKIRNGTFYYYHKTGYLDSSGTYANGRLNGSWGFYSDSGRTIRRKDYENGLLVKDTVYQQTSADSIKKDPLPGEIESEFKGGLNKWAQFLNRNLHYPERAMNARMGGTIILQFIVDETGMVTDPELFKSVEYSLDAEALRIIRKSPAWLPASKDGERRKSYKRQPITFRMP